MRLCAGCRRVLPPKRARYGPLPLYCSVACRRARENERARAARRARREAWLRDTWGDVPAELGEDMATDVVMTGERAADGHTGGAEAAAHERPPRGGWKGP